jgi:putative peptidoglycan lipid II flippase
MRLSITLAGMTIARLALSTLSQLFILASLGVGVQTDALVAGSLLPQLAITLIATSLNQVLVPLFASEPAENARRDAWTAFVTLVALFGLIAGLLAATADVWVAVVTPGFSAAGKALTVELTRIQLLGMLFTVPFSVLWSMHCARGRLLKAEFVQAVSVAITSAFIVLAVPRFGVQAAAASTVIRPMIDVALLAGVLGRWAGFSARSTLLRTAWLRVRYLLIGSAYYGTEPLVNQVLVSFAPQGSLSILFTGQQIYSLLTQVINKSIAAPAIPMLAVRAHAGDWPAFRDLYHKRIWWTSALGALVVGGMIVLGPPILSLLVGRGNFSLETVDLLWRVLIALSGVCVGGFVAQVTIGGLHAMGDTRTPTKLGMVTYTLYIPVKILAFVTHGLLGMAVATSAFFVTNMLGQLYYLERNTRRHLQVQPARYEPR